MSAYIKGKNLTYFDNYKKQLWRPENLTLQVGFDTALRQPIFKVGSPNFTCSHLFHNKQVRNQSLPPTAFLSPISLFPAIVRGLTIRYIIYILSMCFQKINIFWEIEWVKVTPLEKLVDFSIRYCFRTI